jgi:lipoprotein-releasing system permease protein
MFELFSAWKYLYNPRELPLVKKLLMLSIAVSVIGLLMFIFSHTNLQFWGVIIFSIGSLFTLILLLLRVFSVFTTISIASVLVGTMVITIVWCVSSGFQREFKEKILGVNGHILIMTYGTPFSNYKEPLEICRQDPGVIEAAPFNLNEMLATRDSKHSGILVKGIDPLIAPRVLDLPKQLISGSMEGLLKNSNYSPESNTSTQDDSEETVTEEKKNNYIKAKHCLGKDNKWPGIILGKGLAKRLNVKTGDSITLISPLSQFSYTGSEEDTVPKIKEIDFCVVGIFFAGFEEYDQKLSYAHLKVTRHFNPKLPKDGENIFGLEMRLKNMDDADIVAGRLRQKLSKHGLNLRVVTWGELNPQVFQNLQFHKQVIWILLFFLITVSAFGVLSALYMLVLDKKREISTMKALGASDSSIAWIFVFSGGLIGILGMVLGEGMGFVVSFMLKSYSFPLDPEVYIISHLPVSIKPENFLWISVVTLALCFISTFFPAIKAAKAKTIDGLVKNRT